MHIRITPLAAALLATFACSAAADDGTTAAVSSGASAATVTVRGGRPTSLPKQIPTTVEGIDARELDETVNATDAEDALKYFPSLLVRKRFIGDYNHAVLSTRASGTGNSARSMVYADGILLSNLLGNGAAFTPRWALVTPEEIERVDVLYGPFSAAYSGNAAGAVVDYVTRMPDRFEAHARVNLASQRFDLYSTSERDSARQVAASVGNRAGAFAWYLSANRLASDGQPLVFANRLLSEGSAPSAGAVPVTGAVRGLNGRNQDWWLLGTTTRYSTVQDHAKLKLSWDPLPDMRATYVFGAWRNDTDGKAESWLRDAAGKPVTGGRVLIDGRQYNLDAPALAFADGANELEHTMHGLTLKTATRGVFDWEVAASRYDYDRDIARAPTTSTGSAGRITDMHGTGWRTLSLRGTWRPTGSEAHTGDHGIEFGLQDDAFRLRTLVSNTADWRDGAAGARFSAFNGNTRLQSLFLQDTWRFATDWKATLGLRREDWRADGGELANATTVLPFAVRRERHLSPKAAISRALDDGWILKASVGRAVRMPTVGELYQGSINGNAIVNTDPTLRPEKSWTTETSAERWTDDGVFRATVFWERTRDALYTQPLTATVSTVQNIGAIRTLGAEVVWQSRELWIRGLRLGASATYARSTIVENPAYPASVGMQQPRVPRWRATGVATWQPDERWTLTLAARYSGEQFGQLDNGDTNGFAYMAFSKFFVADARAKLALTKEWSAAVGIDNLNNYRYWAFHPYPQRTFVAELRYDLR